MLREQNGRSEPKQGQGARLAYPSQPEETRAAGWPERAKSVIRFATSNGRLDRFPGFCIPRKWGRHSCLPRRGDRLEACRYLPATGYTDWKTGLMSRPVRALLKERERKIQYRGLLSPHQGRRLGEVPAQAVFRLTHAARASTSLTVHVSGLMDSQEGHLKCSWLARAASYSSCRNLSVGIAFVAISMNFGSFSDS